MPYKVKGKCVYKKDTGKKVGCTKGSVKKYLAALHANANESIDHELTNEDLEEIVLEEYTRLLNEGPPTPKGSSLPAIIRRLASPRIPFVRGRLPTVPDAPNVGKLTTGTNINLADEASLESLAQSIGENPPWEISDIPASPVTKRITQPTHYESELERMTLPAPTETSAIDPALRQRYFGDDPDLMYRRIPSGPGRSVLYDTSEDMGLVPDPDIYGWDPLATGGYRRVYEIPGQSDKVLKVAAPGEATGFPEDVGHSEMMNRMEALQAYQTHPSGLAAKVYDMAPDGTWIVQEKVTPFRDWAEMFEHFPNFKKEMELFSQGDPERAWKWRFTASDVFSKILQFNEPLSKIEMSKTIEWVKRLEDVVRNSKSEYTAAEIDRMVREVSELRMRPGIKAYEKTGELFGYNFGRDAIIYDERIINYLNNLITDPVVSNIRDFARSTSQHKPAYAVWDYNPKNLGLDKNGKIKILDSGYGLGIKD